MSSNSPAVRQLKVAAMFLMVLACCSMLYFIYAILLGAGVGIGAAGGLQGLGIGDKLGAMATNSFGAVAMPIISLMASANVFYGALKMFKLENYRWAIASAVIGTIPCLSPCLFLGMPFGIWAIVLMMKDDVKYAFPP